MNDTLLLQSINFVADAISRQNEILGEIRDRLPLGVEDALGEAAIGLQDERDALKAAKDQAYAERNKLVAALSKFLPAWLERHPEHEEWEDDWRWTVFIDGPTRQMTWHIHDSELPLFDHLPRSNSHRWDGHTTEEKYERLAALESVDGR